MFLNTKNLANFEKNKLTRKTITENNCKMENNSKVFTDGSKMENKNGVGIYFKKSKEIMSLLINKNLTIKSLETLAILLAVNITSKIFTLNRESKQSVSIFSDSKSTLKSLEHSITKKK